MNKLKKGLTYISERGSFYRYSDKVQDEKWLSPLSEYIPLEKIMRGQPVSIATDDDIKEAAHNLAQKYYKDNEETTLEDFEVEIKGYLDEDSHTFVVLTRPERHTNSIGLSYEYTPGPEYNEEEKTLAFSDMIHILDSGRFDIDPDYLLKSYQVESVEDLVKNVINVEEYVPPFFEGNYKDIIGKQIYVKGNAAGELTIIPEEAYLGYNNIIKLGFISDAWIRGNNIAAIKAVLDKPEEERTPEEIELLTKLTKDEENPSNLEEFIENSVSIQVQIQGDDRGALDSTIFEGIVGEDVVIDKNDPIRVFALGQEDDVAFSARINITPSTSHIEGINTKTAFIGFQKMDGKTELVTFGDDFDLVAAKDSGVTEDAAFLTVAQIYDPSFYSTYTPHAAQYINDIGQNIKLTQESLGSAIKAAWLALTGWEMNVEEYNNIQDESTSGYLKITSSEPGGYYYMYISSDLQKVFLQDSLTYTNGSSNNKGYVVLADNRIAARQNVIGVYMSGIYGENLKGRKCIFIHDGLFRHEGAVDGKYQEIGKEYFLGRHGFVTRIPDTAYETVVKIMDVQDENKVLVHCDNMRLKTRGGDLPLGYTKPAVKIGNQYTSEYGFVLMDGVTLYPVDIYPALYERLQGWFAKNKLDAENPDDPGKAYFKIPLCTTTTDANGESTIMQIKAMEYGLYEKEPRIPYIRKIGDFEPDHEKAVITVNGKKYLEGVSVPLIGKYDVTTVVRGEEVTEHFDTRFEITPICDLCIMENLIEEPTLENLEIRLFVDPEYSDATHSAQYHWVELRSGFQNYNNNTTYGFEWKIEREDPTNECPFGRYFLSTDIKEGMGLYYQTAGNNSPTRLSGHPWKLVVGRHETVAQQYDLDGVMHGYLRNRTTDEEGRPYTTKAVTGAAVIDAIENRYFVRNLVAYPHVVDDNGNVTSESHILLGRENEPATEVGLSAINEIKVYSPEGIKLENTLKRGPYEEDRKIIVKDNWISVIKGTDENNHKIDDVPTFGQLDTNDFVTKGQVEEHTERYATDWTYENAGTDQTKVVHGMIFGPRGNVDASLFNGLPLGNHHQQRVVNGGSMTGPEVDASHPSYIPYRYYGSNPLSTDTYDWISSIEGIQLYNKIDITGDTQPGHIKGIYAASRFTESHDSVNEIDELTYTTQVNNNYKIYNSVVKGIAADSEGHTTPVTYTVKYNFNTDAGISDISFLKTVNGETAPASITAASIGAGSRVAYKHIFSELVNDYTFTPDISSYIDTAKEGDWNHFDYNNENTEYVGSALQAAYELPLALWRYRTEPTWYKKYIGILIERVNDMRDNLKTGDKRKIFSTFDQQYWAGKDDEGNPKNTNSTKPFNSDDNTFNYSDDELLSIRTYLNLITDNAESTQNINTTVGLLLKAAKETQERLLKVEASTFGADSPTIPGHRAPIMFENTPDVTPEATHLGLNRLIRAIAIELYGTPNPDDGVLKNIEESNNTSTTLSRIDELETEIEGKTFDTNVGTDAADNNLVNISSATYPYEINEETSHGGVTYSEVTRDDYLLVTQNEETKELTYHSSIENTTKVVQPEDTLYYLNKNDENHDYIIYDGDRVEISIPDDGKELYVKETIRDVLANNNPVDGRKAEDSDTEDSENHGTWTKIHLEKDANFEVGSDGKFIQDTDHNIVPEDARYNFNGTIDAISRICTKVNALTYSINGKDNINSTPERLNTIRNNIETLIKEAYFDGAPVTTVEGETATTETRTESQAYVDEDLDHTDTNRTLFPQPSTPYTGTVSRFDQLSKDLYDYVIDGFKDSKDTLYTNINYEHNGEDETGKSIQYTSQEDVDNLGASKKQVLVGRTFNGKQLLVDGISDSTGADVTDFNQTHADHELPKSFHLNVPDSIEEYNYASIIDILIDAIGAGHFRHQISGTDSTPEELRPTKTLTDRIIQIEQALDNVVHKLSQKHYYENDTTKVHDSDNLFENSTSNPTYSIEDFITHLNDWLGLSTFSDRTEWKQSISAEIACGYPGNNDPILKDRYFITINDRTEFVDADNNIQPVADDETYYVYDLLTKTYKIAESDDIVRGLPTYVKREVTDVNDYLNNADPVVNSNYVIKQLLKRLRKEESFYEVLKIILGKDYDIEHAFNNCKIENDTTTGLQKITGEVTYNITDDIKDLLLTIYGKDELVSRTGVQTTYEHRSTIGDNSYVSAHCWIDENNNKVFTSAYCKAGANIWATAALDQYETDADLIGKVATFTNDQITDETGKVYTRFAEGDIAESSDSLNTRFTGNPQTRNIIDDIVKELYFVPDPVKYDSSEEEHDDNGTISKTYTENTTNPVDSKDVKYNENNTYYDIDKGNYHYDYEHNADDPDGGAVGKAIGYQNRSSLFGDHTAEAGTEHRRSRFEILENELRNLRSFLGLNEIIDNNVIGNEKAAETVYGGKFFGTSDTSLAGHKFSGDATRNGNFFAKSDGSHDPNTSAESNLLTMIFNLSNSLRDISRELGNEVQVRGVEYNDFEQLNKARPDGQTIYERLVALEDTLGNLLGIVNRGPNQEPDIEDDREDGTINIQWIEE